MEVLQGAMEKEGREVSLPGEAEVCWADKTRESILRRMNIRQNGKDLAG